MKIKEILQIAEKGLGNINEQEKMWDIKYELIPYDDFIGSKEFDIDKTIYDLNSQMELLSNQADNLDYFVALQVVLHVVCWIFFRVGEFNLANGRSVASDKVDAFVKKTAEMFEGEKFDDVKSAVKALEKRFPIPSDGNTPDFGGGFATSSERFCSPSDNCGVGIFVIDSVYREIIWNRC